MAMEYEGQICRPPMERASFMLPVAVGCSYNRCIFCTLFKHVSSRLLPMEQIQAELSRVKTLGGNPERVFLGDGNAFGLPTERLLEILDRIHEAFPACREVNMDATVTNIREKSDEELRALFQAGARGLYLGIESGMAKVLRFMKKDHTPEEAYREIGRIREQGFSYNAHLMLGLAGKGNGQKNAEETARFINRTEPDRIINFTIFLHREAPLWREIERGTFVPADEYENLLEERSLIEQIGDFSLLYDGFHDNIKVRTRGKLPEDREKMLIHLDRAAERLLYEKRNKKKD